MKTIIFCETQPHFEELHLPNQVRPANDTDIIRNLAIQSISDENFSWISDFRIFSKNRGLGSEGGNEKYPGVERVKDKTEGKPTIRIKYTREHTKAIDIVRHSLSI